MREEDDGGLFTPSENGNHYSPLSNSLMSIAMRTLRLQSSLPWGNGGTDCRGLAFFLSENSGGIHNLFDARFLCGLCVETLLE